MSAGATVTFDPARELAGRYRLHHPARQALAGQWNRASHLDRDGNGGIGVSSCLSSGATTGVTLSVDDLVAVTP